MKKKSTMTAKIKATWNGNGWDCIVKTNDKSLAEKFHLCRKSRVDNICLCDEYVCGIALFEHNGLDSGIICEELGIKAE